MSDRCFECGSMDFACMSCLYEPLVARVDELERMLAHETERYLKQLALRQRAEVNAAAADRQLQGQIEGNAKLLAQLKMQGAALRAAGIEDRPINFPAPVLPVEPPTPNLGAISSKSVVGPVEPQ